MSVGRGCASRLSVRFWRHLPAERRTRAAAGTGRTGMAPPEQRRAGPLQRFYSGTMVIEAGMNSMIRSACCAASGAAMPVSKHR